MDAPTIQSILEAGNIGEMSFPQWLEQVGNAPDINDIPHIAKTMADLGIVSVRWESGDRRPKESLWQAYLVVTLPASSIPTVSMSSTSYLSSLPSLRMLETIAVEKCGSYFYFLTGQELWIEYMVARPEVRAAIQSGLAAGKIGDMPYATWLEYGGASTNIWIISGILAALGVVSVRWEQSVIDRSWGRWQAYLVITLPISASSSPPTLPSFRLVHSIAMAVRGLDDYSPQAAERHVELWVSLYMPLPLDDRAIELLKAQGITYVDAIPSGEKSPASLRTGWQALLNFSRRSKLVI